MHLPALFSFDCSERAALARIPLRAGEWFAYGRALLVISKHVPRIIGPLRRLGLSLAFAIIGVLLVLSGSAAPVTPVDAIANPPVVAVARGPELAIAMSPLHGGSTHVRCILCGQDVCADHDLALPSASPDAVLPAKVCLLPRSMTVGLLPPARAPPAIASAVGASFDPRGPPLLS